MQFHRSLDRYEIEMDQYLGDGTICPELMVPDFTAERES